MTLLTRKLRYALWVLNGFMGRKASLRSPQKATVLITYYHPARMKHIEPQVRNILKCDFVENLVISNHNPDVNIQDKVKVKDRRLHFLNQTTRQGCGYRWIVANELNPEYLIVIDDDILFFPRQLTQLFERLVAEPMMPHGIAGMLNPNHEVLEYHERKDMTVDFLCEAYAVTRGQVNRYMELRKLVAIDQEMMRMIDSAADFMIISGTGSRKPKIHNVGRLFKSETFKEVGVAVHKSDEFNSIIMEVSQAMEQAQIQVG